MIEKPPLELNKEFQYALDLLEKTNASILSLVEQVQVNPLYYSYLEIQQEKKWPF